MLRAYVRDSATSTLYQIASAAKVVRAISHVAGYIIPEDSSIVFGKCVSRIVGPQILSKVGKGDAISEQWSDGLSILFVCLPIVDIVLGSWLAGLVGPNCGD